MKRLAIALTMVTAVFAFGGAASAQYTPSLTPPATGPQAGANFTVGVAGCAPGDAITYTFAGTNGGATADGTGAATLALTAPATAGDYVLSVTCSNTNVQATIGVLGPTPPTNGGGTPGGGGTGGTPTLDVLPATGSDGTSTTLLIGLGALVVGLGLFGTSQIRRRQSAAD